MIWLRLLLRLDLSHLRIFEDALSDWARFSVWYLMAKKLANTESPPHTFHLFEPIHLERICPRHRKHPRQWRGEEPSGGICLKDLMPIAFLQYMIVSLLECLLFSFDRYHSSILWEDKVLPLLANALHRVESCRRKKYCNANSQYFDNSQFSQGLRSTGEQPLPISFPSSGMWYHQEQTHHLRTQIPLPSLQGVYS